MSNYVCREHTLEPVTVKGTGCRQCDRERRYGRRRSSDDTTLSGEGWDRWRDQHTAVHTVEVPE